MANIFITGASGNVGSRTVQYLQGTGSAFTAGLTKTPEQDPGYPWAVINFAQEDSLVKAFEGHDVVFCIFPVVEPLMDWAKNTLAAAKKAGVKHILRSGAASADPNSPYALLKIHGEIDVLFQESGIPCTITKPSSFMQNFSTFLAYPIQQGRVYSASGAGKSAWIDVRDVAAIHGKILQNPAIYVNQSYTLTGSELLSMEMCLQRIGQTLGREIAYQAISPEASIETLTQFGTPEPVAHLLASLNQGTQEGVLDHQSPHAQQLLGRETVRLDRFVQDHLAVWQPHESNTWG